MLDTSANASMGPKMQQKMASDLRSAPVMNGTPGQRNNPAPRGGDIEGRIRDLRQPSIDEDQQSIGGDSAIVPGREMSRRLMDRESSREHFSRKFQDVCSKLDELKSHEQTVEKRLEEVHLRIMKEIQPKLPVVPTMPAIHAGDEEGGPGM